MLYRFDLEDDEFAVFHFNSDDEAVDFALWEFEDYDELHRQVWHITEMSDDGKYEDLRTVW